MLAAAALATVLGLAAALVIWHAQRTLNRSAQAVAAGRDLMVQVGLVTPLPNPGFEAISAPTVFAGGAFFAGSYYLDGPGGLFAWSPDGVLEHAYRPGQDFPATVPGAMTVGTLADAQRPELLIATNSEGVLAFDGQRFRQIRPADAGARDVTALLAPGSGRLLLGTERRGLLVYDGHALRPFHASTNTIRVTALVGTESDLWIGTQAGGLVHWRGGAAETIGVAQGLPDARVEALAIAGDSVFAGTPVGVAELQGGMVIRTLASGHFAHAVTVDRGRLLVGQVEEGVLETPLGGAAPAGSARRPITAETDTVAQPSGTTIQQFLSAGGHTYAVAADGLLERSADGAWKPMLRGASATLAARHVSALLAASDGRLWVGYFDRGLDIVAPSGAATHDEDDPVYCVNRIVEDADAGDVAVATANGLVLFDRDGHPRQVLGSKTGLIADHVTDVARYRGGLVAATPAGITFLGPGGDDSLYTLQGLANNHVYALGVQDGELLAGTLGGLSVLQGETVRRNFTATNSGLQRNWITGLARAGDDWLVGTYGAGIMRLDKDGSVAATDATRAGTVINPAAMLTDGDLVLAGTLGQGLLVGEAGGQRWRTVTAGLPSLDVTALAAAHGVIYVGTESGLVKIQASALQ